MPYPLFQPEALYLAYRQCRKRKRNTAQALEFELDLEANLFALSHELNAGTYTPGPCTAFLVERPKRREIFAADFRDRVVHHLLVGHLEPVWERRFIHDSYACRAGKGTHAAVDRVQHFLRKVTANGTRPVSDGRDFLGYITRPHYRLTRRRGVMPPRWGWEVWDAIWLPRYRLDEALHHTRNSKVVM